MSYLSKRLVAFCNTYPVFLRTYAQRVELSCNGKSWRFRNRDEAMLFLQNMPKYQGRERKRHDFKR